MFPVNTQRRDPYKSCRFDLLLDGRIVQGVTSISAPKMTSQLCVEHQNDGVHISPGPTTYNTMCITRWKTHSDTLERWAQASLASLSGTADEESGLQDYRKDMVIDIFNMDMQRVMRYRFYRCFIASYTPFTDLAGGNFAALQESAEIVYERLTRDWDVSEPREKPFDTVSH